VGGRDVIDDESGESTEEDDVAEARRGD